MKNERDSDHNPHTLPPEICDDAFGYEYHVVAVQGGPMPVEQLNILGYDGWLLTTILPAIGAPEIISKPGQGQMAILMYHFAREIEVNALAKNAVLN